MLLLPDKPGRITVGTQRKLIEEVLQKIPKRAVFSQVFDPHSSASEIFAQNGFSISVIYSSRLHQCNDQGSLWTAFHSTIRNHINRASRAYGITIDQDPCRFAEFYVQNLQNQGRAASPASKRVARRLLSAIASHDSGTGIYAKLPEGKSVAGIYIVWDEKTCFFLFSSRDIPSLKSGALTLLLWEAIKIAGARNLAFDFDRLPSAWQFGAEPVPYWLVRRMPREVWAVKSAMGWV
jgi:hypothetical protein